MSNLLLYLNDLLELFFPRICVTCGNKLLTQEKYTCFDCYCDVPRTNFHLDRENKAAQLFWGRVQAENVFSYYYFRKGSKYQKLIHFLKYKGLYELGHELGRWMGASLSESPEFAGIDMVVPVPLHKKKEKQRGYNQSEWIARGVSEYMKKPLSTGNLLRTVYTPTQTRKRRYERWENVEGIFSVSDMEQFRNKHILLIDDVLTTGSTLESCSVELLKIQGVKVSIATLAYSDL